MRGLPKRERKTDEEARSCDVCGRTILKGERTEVYLAPGGRRKPVCEPCGPRADHEGWIREAAHADLPAARARPAQRRSLAARVRGLFEREPLPAERGAGEPPPVPEDGDDPAAPPAREAPPSRERAPARPRDGRQVRAIPTTAEVKVERALELFNSSDHPRTIPGLARTTGP